MLAHLKQVNLVIEALYHGSLLPCIWSKIPWNNIYIFFVLMNIAHTMNIFTFQNLNFSGFLQFHTKHCILFFRDMEEIVLLLLSFFQIQLPVWASYRFRANVECHCGLWDFLALAPPLTVYFLLLLQLPHLDLSLLLLWQLFHPFRYNSRAHSTCRRVLSTVHTSWNADHKTCMFEKPVKTGTQKIIKYQIQDIPIRENSNLVFTQSWLCKDSLTCKERSPVHHVPLSCGSVTDACTKIDCHKPECWMLDDMTQYA